MRRLRWFVLAFALAVSVAGVLAWLMPRDPISRANYDRIQLGMTRDEVEAIIGPTADAGVPDARGAMIFTPVQDTLDTQGEPRVMRDFIILRNENGRIVDELNPLYQSRRRSILIAYGLDGRVVGKEFSRVRQFDWWDSVIDFFGL